jgi:hypothetical protein
MLLNIEARIGELSKEMPKENYRGIPKDARDGGSKEDRLGIPRLRIDNAQAIHRNPAAVAAVIKQARENEDIPTKTAAFMRAYM